MLDGVFDEIQKISDRLGIKVDMGWDTLHGQVDDDITKRVRGELDAGRSATYRDVEEVVADALEGLVLTARDDREALSKAYAILTWADQQMAELPPGTARSRRGGASPGDDVIPDEDGRVHPSGAFWWAVNGPAEPARKNKTPGGYPFRHLERGSVPASEWVADKRVYQEFRDLVFPSRKLRIGLSTLTGQGVPVVEPTDRIQSGLYGFKVTDIDGDVEGDARAAVSRAVDEGVHVLVFPELSVHDPAVHAIREEVSMRPGELVLIVAGSFHRSAGDVSVENSSPILFVRRLGDVQANEGARAKEDAEPKAVVEELTRALKRYPFQLRVSDLSKTPIMSRVQKRVKDLREYEGGDVAEHLLREGTTPMVVTPVGVFSTLICLDCIQENHAGNGSTLHSRVCRIADHLCVPSMNLSPTADFWGRAESAAREYLVGTYYTNGWLKLGKNKASTHAMFWVVPRVDGVRAVPHVEPRLEAKVTRVSVLHDPKIGGAFAQARVSEWPEDGFHMVEIPISRRAVEAAG